MKCDKWLHIYGNKLGIGVKCEWVDDVRENVKGEWIVESVDLFHGEEVGESYICSVCGKDAFDKFDFCPNCGADMRGEA